MNTSNKKSICERKRCCKTCGALQSGMTYDCSKRYCYTFKQIRATGHLCYMRSLKDVLPANACNILCIFYDVETTSIKRIPTWTKNMCLTSSACKRFARDVRNSKTVVLIVIDVAGEATHFGMIL